MTHGKTGKLVIPGLILGLAILFGFFLFRPERPLIDLTPIDYRALTVVLTEAAMLEGETFIPKPPELEQPAYYPELEERLRQNAQELEDLKANNSHTDSGITVIHGSNNWANSMLQNTTLREQYERTNPVWQNHRRMLGIRHKARKAAFDIICQTYEQNHQRVALPPYLERFRYIEPNPAYKNMLPQNQACPWTSTMFEEPTGYFMSGPGTAGPLTDTREAVSSTTCDQYGCRKIADFVLERMLRDLNIFNSRGQIEAPAAPSPPSFLDIELEAIKSQSFIYQAEKQQRELQEQQRIQNLHEERTATLLKIREHLCTKYENNRTEERLPTYLLAYKNLDTRQYASDCSWSDAVIAELKRLIPTP